MKKWIIIGSILILFLAGSSVVIYLNATKPVKAAEQKAIETAIEETSLIHAEEFQLYHGDNTYYVVTGTDEANESIIVWIPEQKGDIITRSADEGISRQEAIDILYSEKTPQKIIDVRLGVIENRPVWEIYYRSEQNLINYYYVHFDTGERLRIIENL
ncbi:DUF5590 domain-containing protein [Mesobacillus harenae]|uniref:cell wall elongation regulator TseB-like domain-containing protein n=1 Tax=Mesobacillus harenae TaxID=2213203 RepID=UPI001580B028|nr:DUF5590 domain-containing protein [Mesobacillus harenae]